MTVVTEFGNTDKSCSFPGTKRDPIFRSGKEQDNTLRLVERIESIRSHTAVPGFVAARGAPRDCAVANRLQPPCVKKKSDPTRISGKNCRLYGTREPSPNRVDEVTIPLLPSWSNSTKHVAAGVSVTEYIGIVGGFSGDRCTLVTRGVRRAAKAANLAFVDFGSSGSLAQQVQHAALWPISGILSMVPNVQVQCPVVELLTPEHTGRSRVDIDHAAVARTSFTHLRTQNPASLNLLRTPTCRPAFLDAWAESTSDKTLNYGEFVATARSPTLSDISDAERDRLREWLKHLAKPAALVCTTDAMAAYCIDFFHRSGLSVPDDAAILSCENSAVAEQLGICLLYTSPSPRDRTRSRMPSSA